MSPEAIEKARQSHVGKKRTPEQKERMRLAAIKRWEDRKEKEEEENEE